MAEVFRPNVFRARNLVPTEETKIRGVRSRKVFNWLTQLAMLGETAIAESLFRQPNSTTRHHGVGSARQKRTEPIRSDFANQPPFHSITGTKLSEVVALRFHFNTQEKRNGFSTH
jgi:hypothetical protein